MISLIKPETTMSPKCIVKAHHNAHWIHHSQGAGRGDFLRSCDWTKLNKTLHWIPPRFLNFTYKIRNVSCTCNPRWMIIWVSITFIQIEHRFQKIFIPTLSKAIKNSKGEGGVKRQNFWMKVWTKARHFWRDWVGRGGDIERRFKPKNHHGKGYGIF